MKSKILISFLYHYDALDKILQALIFLGFLICRFFPPNRRIFYSLQF